ncbi:MAG: hypothetical protein V4507_05020 [Verrucomicrobiota bacterium]
MKCWIIYFFCSVSLFCQYQGILTSIDHTPGNIISTTALDSSLGVTGNIRKTIPSNSSETISDQITQATPNTPPHSRSYYLWAEATSSTLFAGNLSAVLLAAATVNGYEDIATISITGPKAGVNATRWDLPFQMHLAYALSTGSTPLGDAPTTATTYARSGSSASFISTDATSQIALSYKTSADGAPQDNWSDAYALASGSETDATLVPSALEATVNQPYYNSISFSSFHLALMQSSIRDVAAYNTYRIFPIPTPTSAFSSNLGTPTRNEKIGNTTYIAYSLETDSVALPTYTLSASNGFPLTRWEIIHVNPDGSTQTVFSGTAGTSTSNPVALDATSLKLNDLVKTAGTHYFRVYNRFDNVDIPESSELISELALTVQFVVRVKANIHTYE